MLFICINYFSSIVFVNCSTNDKDDRKALNYEHEKSYEFQTNFLSLRCQRHLFTLRIISMHQISHLSNFYVIEYPVIKINIINRKKLLYTYQFLQLITIEIPRAMIEA